MTADTLLAVLHDAICNGDPLAVRAANDFLNDKGENILFERLLGPCPPVPVRLEGEFCLDGIRAKALHFESPFNPRHRYVVLAGGMDYADFLSRYNSGVFGPVECRRAEGVNIERHERGFFLCYIEDCSDPPCAVVRAGRACDAIDAFIDAFEWTRMDVETVEERDGHGETVGFTRRGHAYDAEPMACHQVRLVHVELA